MNAAHVPAYPPPNATTPIIIYLQKATSFAGLNSGLPGLIGTQVNVDLTKSQLCFQVEFDVKHSYISYSS